MYNAEKLTNIYVKYGITPNQFYVLYLIYSKDWNNLYRYKENVISKVTKNDKGESINLHGFDVEEELQPLIDKGYLEDPFTRGVSRSNFEIVDLMVTPTFSSKIFIDSWQAGEELWKLYPHFLEINGQKVVAKKGGEMNGKYYGKEELIELYSKKIGNSRDKHDWILRKTKLAIDQKVINFPIRNFIYDEMWEAFEELEDTGNKNVFI